MRQPDDAALLDMLVLAKSVLRRVEGLSREDFERDEDIQIVLTHLIQTIGEAASQSSQTLRAKYPQIPWHEIIGMRHRIVHDYLNVLPEIIWDTAHKDIPSLILALEAIVSLQDPDVDS